MELDQLDLLNLLNMSNMLFLLIHYPNMYPYLLFESRYTGVWGNWGITMAFESKLHISMGYS